MAHQIKNKHQVMIFNHVIIGALLGYFILHPLTMVIYWFEFNQPNSLIEVVQIVFQRVFFSFNLHMIYMSATFLLIGGLIGLGSGLYYGSILKKNRLLARQENELQRNIIALIDLGESATLEFKAALRWEIAKEGPSKELELANIKTIAGFMNANGGTLIVGVDDNGEIVGLDHDYATLKRKNRDGFEQYIMRMVASRIGTQFCLYVHVIFHSAGGKDICRIHIESATQPAYVHDKNKARFFLRTGNVTHELNTQEAVEYISQRS